MLDRGPGCDCIAAIFAYGLVTCHESMMPKTDAAFRKEIMLKLLESITFIRFDRIDQNAS
jgi:hypothetical protein